MTISGWFGHRNVGDEAQLFALMQTIRKFLPDAELTVISDDPEATAREHAVRVLPKKGLTSRFRLFREIRESALFVLGGGGLLYDVGTGYNPITWLKEALWACLASTPVVYLNGGVGLIYHPLSRYWVKRVCSAMEWITVRDHLSRRHLRGIGITNPIQVTADSALLLNNFLDLSWSGARKHAPLSTPRIGMNLRPWLYMREDTPRKGQNTSRAYGGTRDDFIRFRKDVAGFIDYLNREKRGHVTLFPICLSEEEENENDMAISEEISQLASWSQPITLIQGRCAFRDIIEAMKDFEVVVAMRLHALIFAALLRCPMLAISYDPKVDAFMEALGQVEFNIPIQRVSKGLLVEKFETLQEKRETVRRTLDEKVPQLAERAGGAIEALLARTLERKVPRTHRTIRGLALASVLLPSLLPLPVWRGIHLYRRHRDLPLALWASRVMDMLGGKRFEMPSRGPCSAYHYGPWKSE